MEKIKKDIHGITLVALSITIIILFILSGIVISQLSNGGLFNKTKIAKEKSQNAQFEEDEKLKEYENAIKYGDIISDRESIPLVFNKIEETTQINEFDYVPDKTDGQIFTVPEDGYYKIECWGAQGGTYNAVGGKGAYTKGIIKLSKNDKIFVYVGECYNGYRNTMSFNGGGSGSYYQNRYMTNGGGATDIRIQTENANWDDFDSLKTRIMVAAGGGGGYKNTSDTRFIINGGSAGALTSRNSGWTNTYDGSSTYNSYGATQTSGGIVRTNSVNAYYNGSFGKGGYLDYGSCDYPAGGGGYYGGSTGGARPGVVYGSTGGSSYISGYEGCNSISSESTESNIIHTGNVIHYSGRYFLYAQMESGDNYMPLSSDTESQELGHSGSGHVKITKMNME